MCPQPPLRSYEYSNQVTRQTVSLKDQLTKLRAIRAEMDQVLDHQAFYACMNCHRLSITSSNNSCCKFEKIRKGCYGLGHPIDMESLLVFMADHQEF